MRRSFNLIDNPWIPCLDVGYVSLRTLFETPSLQALGGTVLEKIALTKFLLALTQAAITPKNNKEAYCLGTKGMAHHVILYLERWYTRFNLYGNEPFLQFPQVIVGELQSYGSLIPYVATGNTTCLSQYHIEKKVEDAQRALLLIVQMGFAFGGKKTDNTINLSVGYQGKVNTKGRPTTSKPGPGIEHLGLLHSFALGKSLHETLWLNLATEQDIQNMAIFSEGVGIAPWEQMPKGEDCDTARHLKKSLMGRLVPLCRFCLLTDAGVYITEGIQHLNYRSLIYDPSITLITVKPAIRALWCDSVKRAWRDLPAMLGGIFGEVEYGRCYQLNIAYARAKLMLSEFIIWSGGVKLSSNAGEQYLSGSDDVVESIYSISISALNSDDWFDCLVRVLEKLEVLAKCLFSAVKNYFVTLNGDGIAVAQRATDYFWMLCESEVANLLEYCQQSPQRQRLKSQYIFYLEQCYSKFCPNQTARQLKSWMQCYPYYSERRAREEAGDGFILENSLL